MSSSLYTGEIIVSARTYIRRKQKLTSHCVRPRLHVGAREGTRSIRADPEYRTDSAFSARIQPLSNKLLPVLRSRVGESHNLRRGKRGGDSRRLSGNASAGCLWYESLDAAETLPELGIWIIDLSSGRKLFKDAENTLTDVGRWGSSSRECKGTVDNDSAYRKSVRRVFV